MPLGPRFAPALRTPPLRPFLRSFLARNSKGMRPCFGVARSSLSPGGAAPFAFWPLRGLMPAGPLRGLPGPPPAGRAARAASRARSGACALASLAGPAPLRSPPAPPPARHRPRFAAGSCRACYPRSPAAPSAPLRAPAACALVALALLRVGFGLRVGRRVPPARAPSGLRGGCFLAGGQAAASGCSVGFAPPALCGLRPLLAAFAAALGPALWPVLR